MKRETVARGLRRAVVAVAAASLLVGLAACGGDADPAAESETSAAANPDGIDDGTKLTLWTRAPLEAQAKALVEAYNSSHKNQVELTITPNDDYVAKVGAAAGSGDLPDLFAADIVYVPNWTEAGLFADITEPDRRAALRGRDQPGAPRGRHVRGQEVRAAVRARPLGDLLQQGPLRGGRAGPGARARPPWPSSRSTPSPSRS